MDFAFQRIGGKYKARILWHLYENTVLRNSEIKRLIPGITPKMLSITLKELEKDHLIIRKSYNEVPPRVEYRLTETGIKLSPILLDIKKWAEEFLITKTTNE
ncbi:helix-turn-helix domain-containing protein [Weeksellaceae bacterium A-14]